MRQRTVWIAGAAALLLGGCEGSAELAEKVAALERRQGELEERLRALEARRAAPGEAPGPAPEPAPVAGGWEELAAALAAPEAEGVGRLRALVTRGVDVGQAGPEGQRALVLAAAAGKLELLRLLLGEGRVPVDQREEERGETALMAAAGAGHAAAVDLLLQAGADPTLVSGVWAEEQGGPFLTARGRAEAAGAADLAKRLEEAGWNRTSRQGAIVLLDRLAVTPMGEGLSEPVEVVVGRQDGSWGRLAFEVQREPLALEDDATSLAPATRNQSLFRIPLTWRQGQASGRHDLVVNHPNAGEDALAGVLELTLPGGRLRVELELRALEVE